MLRFFRQIRQRLLTDNKFSKYLLYAVGEIVLVVIGILIALQINNWAEHKKDESLYYTYLLRLKSDSENLLDMIRLSKDVEDRLVALTRYQLDFLNGELNVLDTLELAVSIEFTAGINPYSLNMPAYSELESTGRLILIQSDSLKQELANFQQYAIQRQSNQSEWDPWVFKYRSLVRNLLDSEDRIRINDLWSTIPDVSLQPNSSWFKAYFNSNFPKDFALKTEGKKLIKNFLGIEELPGLVTDIYIVRSITQGLLIQEEANTLNLIRLIENEIDRLDN